MGRKCSRKITLWKETFPYEFPGRGTLEGESRGWEKSQVGSSDTMNLTGQQSPSSFSGRPSSLVVAPNVSVTPVPFLSRT